ncbi:MAG: hypothetical protein ACPH9C_00160 [Candidatus Puniceispirillales bacterium]
MIALEKTNHRWRQCFGMVMIMITLISVMMPVKPSFAHASGQSFVMLLPTDIYTLGGVIVVGLTIILLALIPVTGTSGLHRNLALFGSFRIGRKIRFIHGLALLYFFWLLSAGWYGTTDPLRNPLTLGFWAVFWMGLVMVEGLFFGIWRWINPWVFAYHMIRRISGRHRIMDWPSWLAYWPGVLLLLGFAIFTLADPAPTDPARLASFMFAYWLFTLIGMLIFGFRTWSRHVELFSMIMVSFGSLRMVSFHAGRLRVGLPGWRLMANRQVGVLRPHISAAIFLLMLLGIGSFDGFNETFVWLNWININPLDFPGRSAIIMPTISGIVLANLALIVIFGILIWLGMMAASENPQHRYALVDLIGVYAASLLPIALAYHVAHYLPSLLVEMQYVALAIDGMFGRNIHILGLDGFHVTDGFFKHLDWVRMIWLTQAGIVVAGHVISVLIAHHMATARYENRFEIIISQLPIAIFMIGYTWLGLWLLAAPKGG